MRTPHNISNLGVRARIALLVVLAALPTLALTIYGSLDERERAVANARKDMQKLATLAARQQARIVANARQTLVALTLIPPALRQTRALCNDYLARLLAHDYSIYHSVGIIGVDGQMQCNTAPWQEGMTFSDRLYFKLALATGQFSIGEYQMGRITKMQGINFGYPMVDEFGAVTGVAYVALNLAALGKITAAVPLPEGGRIAVIDREGIVLAHYPQGAGRVGTRLAFTPILNAVLAGTEGEFEAKGAGELDYHVVFRSAASNPDGRIAMRVVVSVPKHLILADADRALIQDIARILVASALLLVGAWFGAEIFILRSIRSLLGAAKQVENGVLSARTGLAGGRDELAQLGRAFDTMASALQAREADLQRALQDLERQAITDPLTGLHNRRFLYDALPRELARARRTGAPIAVLMIDIDNFKRVNDVHGHTAGDRVLQEVARAIKTTIRGSDLSCRYGGEEIVVVLADSPPEGTRVRAEAIRAAVEALRIDSAGEQPIGVTISLGVAIFPGSGNDADATLRLADEAMYAAKRAGRNRVEFAPSANQLASA